MAETLNTNRYNNYALSSAFKLFSKYFAIEMLVCTSGELFIYMCEFCCIL